jgi:hypothetical protein
MRQPITAGAVALLLRGGSYVLTVVVHSPLKVTAKWRWG